MALLLLSVPALAGKGKGNSNGNGNDQKPGNAAESPVGPTISSDFSSISASISQPATSETVATLTQTAPKSVITSIPVITATTFIRPITTIITATAIASLLPSPTSDTASDSLSSSNSENNKPYYIIAGVVGGIVLLGIMSYVYYAFNKDDEPPARLDQLPAAPAGKSLDRSIPPQKYAEYETWRETLNHKELPLPPQAALAAQPIDQPQLQQYYAQQPVYEEHYYNNHTEYYPEHENQQQQQYYAYDAQFYPSQAQ